jgi:hypothetical protein
VNNPGVQIFLDSNSIFSNTALGIDLGPSGITSNDLLDADPGANLQQNFPMLTGTSAPVALSAASAKGGDGASDTLAAAVTVSGTLASAPSQTYTVHWYFAADSQCVQNQTQSRPLASGRVPGVVTDAQGNAPFSFPFSFPAGTTGGVINCTATDAQGNTSEFSACLPVSARPPAPGTLQFGAATYGVGEGGGAATITVTREGGSDGQVSINYATADGTAAAGVDYSASSGTLTWADGDAAPKSVTVPVTSDGADEPDETVNLTLGGPAGGAGPGGQGTAVLTIADDDAPPALSIGDVSVTEGNGGTVNAAFAVTISAASGKTVSASFATADGTASAGADYQAATGSLTFNPGETSKTVTVAVNGDTANEPDETFFVNLSGAANATVLDGQGVGTITNDDATLLQFSAASSTVAESSGAVTLTVARAGDTSSPASVSYATFDQTATERQDYQLALGRLSFAPGQTQKTVTVLVTDDVHVEGAETFRVALSDPSAGASLGADSAATVTVTSDDLTLGVNPIDSSEYYVRQQYRDFLGRDPDAGGLAFWVGGIESCGQDQQCREVKKVDTSAAFFLSIEFQETGYLAYRAHKAAFGDLQGKPAPIRLREFLSDSGRIGNGVVVGQPGWPELLEANKAAYFDQFVARAAFAALYPQAMTAAQYVDALNAKAGGPLSQSERDALVTALANGAVTRARALRAVAEDETLRRAELNKAFVLLQYFGYLRRNPDDPQDTNFDGYFFWLGKLEQFGGNYVEAEMVKAFLSSIEYRQRFGQ